GGKIDLASLPVGDPTLSDKEIIGNESQERMGLVMHKVDIETLKKIAERERAPMYVIGEVTGDHRFSFENTGDKQNPIDLELTDMFGNPPRTIMNDISQTESFDSPGYEPANFEKYLTNLLQIEAVACKDWLTNKVDRSVTGKIARQQCAGEIQLPLNDLGAVALDFTGKKGYATSIGHAPVAGLINPAAGSVLAIAEALTNIIWAPLTDHIKSISLSANWMWPSKNPGEDARLYNAVKAASDFAIALGINIPTGKDSLSMTQKYKDGVVYAPGTVIISAAAEVEDVKLIVDPVIKNDTASILVYIDLSRDNHKLGGSSFAQIVNAVGNDAPTVRDAGYFVKAFNVIQALIAKGNIMAGHDISAGGVITTLLEMCFANTNGGLDIDMTRLDEHDTFKLLFSENPGIVIQVKNANILKPLDEADIDYEIIGKPTRQRVVDIRTYHDSFNLDIDYFREKWYVSSYLLDRNQSGKELALERFMNFKSQPLSFSAGSFSGKMANYGISHSRIEKSGIKAAIIREKGVNGDREMAYALHLAGMDVKDIHMTDLIAGREDLADVNMIVFVGGFSNSDVLGSAKGWAGAFLYNEKARLALDNFYKRNDTLSLGVCNGCQLMVELGLIYPRHEAAPQMNFNKSHKFESAFLNVDIQPNNSVMLKSLSGNTLGVWVAHGEGRFTLPGGEDQYNIPITYSYDEYPGNPNGSDFATAAICSDNGRHLAMMPHLERAFLPYQCAWYPEDRQSDEITPWMEAFINAREWIKEKTAHQ
ncbi:MAG TPA: phosphoribosylformylglycinamidine synthase, partial [Bacteroidales bacterium]|nr:phosphoribosylformylglycinamidine synthase [Bacteroidales bacterium]